MKKLLLILILILSFSFCIVTIFDIGQRNNNLQRDLDLQYTLSELLLERLTLTRRNLDLALEFNDLMQEKPQDKKLMQENLLKRLELNKQILKLGEQIISVYED